MTPDEADQLQAAYREQRAAWAEAIGRPFPQRRSSKRKPIPGVIDLDDDEVG